MNLLTPLSLSLNALLLAAYVWMSLEPRIPEARAEASHRPASRVVQEPRQFTRPTTILSRSEVVEVSEPFLWGQVESGDYRVFLANLRAIGCPEPVIRDMIIADINDLFSGRVKALVDEVTGHFWELIANKDAFEKMVEEKHSQLKALQNERDEAIRALFGDKDPQVSGINSHRLPPIPASIRRAPKWTTATASVRSFIA